MIINIKLFFLLVILLMSSNSLFCQQPSESTGTPPLSILWASQPIHLLSIKPFNDYSLTPSNPRQPNNLKNFMTSPNVKPLSGLYEQADLAFFCRLEVKMENAAKLPVKIRLGDVQYVDYLEGKFEPWRYGY